MTSTSTAKVAAAARVAGFLILLLAAVAASLVVFVAVSHAALGSSSPSAKHVVGMHRDPTAAAPHAHRQHSGLRRDGRRFGRSDHQLRAHRAAYRRLGKMRPLHSGSRTTALGRHQASACAARAVRHLVRHHADQCRRAGAGSVQRAQGARHTHVRNHLGPAWQL